MDIEPTHGRNVCFLNQLVPILSIDLQDRRVLSIHVLSGDMRSKQQHGANAGGSRLEEMHDEGVSSDYLSAS